MKKLVVAIVFMCAAQANAGVIVNGMEWDISTIKGSFTANQTLLKGQTWWGNSSLAKQFADAFGGGEPNPLRRGTYFAYAVRGLVDVRIWDSSNSKHTFRNKDRTYGVATKTPTNAVPEPGTIGLLGLGILGLGLIRKQRSA